MEKIDLVLLYVNMQDSVWQKSYFKYLPNKTIDQARFRDWGIFKYFFRCIDKNMPYINKIHMVVSNIEQVPEWIDQEKVHIVLHEDIMPKDLLPCFNSLTLELFLKNIPDLAEQFVYFNDDMFVLNYIDQTKLFRDDKACTIFKHHRLNPTTPIYYQILKKVNDVVFNKIACPIKLEPNEYLVVPHTPVPFLKSSLEEVWEKYEPEIKSSISSLRDRQKDLNPLMYSLYQFAQNKVYLDYPNELYLDGQVPFNYSKFITDNTLQYVCINDEGWTEKDFNWIKKALHEIFEIKFPEKSKYEK